MLNPCFELCYLRYDKQYVPEKCDNSCEFAATLKENERLKELVNTLQNKLNDSSV